MPRIKASPSRFGTTRRPDDPPQPPPPPRPHSPPPPPRPPSPPAAPARPSSREDRNPISAPAYIHASRPPPPGTPARVAVLLQIPLPFATLRRPLPDPSSADNDAFSTSCEEAFSPGPLACAAPVAVIVKHWELGGDVRGSVVQHANPARVLKFLETRDFASNDSLLTVALVDRCGADPVRSFEFSMQGESAPLVVTALVRRGLVSFHWVPDRGVVQVVARVSEGSAMSERDPVMARFLRWLYNYKMGGAVVESNKFYDKEWTFGAVRRRVSDVDAVEYQPFLERVQSNRELNVTLRPYQERAVAWMLSRELGERHHFFKDIVWDDAKHLAPECVLSTCENVAVDAHVSINLVDGQIRRLEERPEGSSPSSTEASGLGDSKVSSVSDVARSDFSEDEHEDGRGGLLCDEMGLGKTVELMQLVLCNKLEQRVDIGEEKVASRLPSSVCLGCRGIVGKGRSSKTCLECGNKAHYNCLGPLKLSVDKFGYVCLRCCEAMERLFQEETLPSELPKSNATLVVIPTTLLLQWQNEIKKHVKDALTVEVFQGLRKSKYFSQRTLMAADVVLTTYDALKADVATFKALRRPRTGLRYARKSRPTPIPLLTVRWHRLALDESQMLGSAGATQAAEMASYLHATYRWCVTGTPITRSLGNAVPMLDILRVQGGRHRMDWSSFLRPSSFAEDEKRVRLALRKVMWRSSKEDVEGEELNLPPQITEVVRTGFGPVEKYHYSSLQQSVQKATLRFRSRADYRAQIVSRDLLTMLRQACCHPQIGISGRRLMSRAARQALNPNTTMRLDDAATKAAKRAQSPLDMNEVLDALVTKANVECQDALRNLVASSNGLAAICWLQYSLLSPRSADVEGLVSAVCIYREALSLAEENKDIVRLDNIQKMHVLFNLNEALQSVSAAKKRLAGLPFGDAVRVRAQQQLNSLGSTLRDADLFREVKVLKREYVAEAEAQLVAATSSYKETFEELGHQPLLAHDEHSNDESSDWNDVLEYLASSGKRHKKKGKSWWYMAVAAVLEKDDKQQDSFVNRTVQKLIDAIPGGGLDVRTLANRLTSLHSFSMVIESELTKLQDSRAKLKSALMLLPGSVRPSQAQVTESGQCRKCREFGTGPVCEHCRTEKLFTDVERHLYCVRERDDSLGLVLDSEEGRSSDRDEPMSFDARIDPTAVVHGVFRPNRRTGGSSNEIAQNSGLRFQSEVETILKALATPLRAKEDDLINREISSWFQRFESLKREHTEARRLFEAQRSLLASMDEVGMALMRLSVLYEGEDFASLPEDEQRHRLPRESLPSLNVQFSNEKAAMEADFRSKRGSLVYLLSLKRTAKRDSSAGTSENTTDHVRKCAVCLAEFDDSVSRIALFVCGHVFCCDCTLLMIRRSDVKARISSVSCPTCRVRCPVEEISFTINRPKEKGTTEIETKEEKTAHDDPGIEEYDEIEAEATKKRKRGSSPDSIMKMRRVEERKSTFYYPHAAVTGLIGAKASAVVRTLRGIWQQDKTSKVLIFSEWLEVLSLISRALLMNGIAHIDGGTRASSMEFAELVDEFKTSISHNILLLPLKRAGAGLNLIEARHVILIEPSMSVSLESQAVGRVHRIGQENTTYVHRIIVNDTIEDRILTLGDAYRGKTGLIDQDTIKLDDVMGVIHSTEELLCPDESGHVVEVPTDSDGGGCV